MQDDGHDKSVDYGKYNDILGFNKSDHSQDKSDYGHDYNHDDYGLAYKYNSCQEYKDCPLLCKDQVQITLCFVPDMLSYADFRSAM